MKVRNDKDVTRVRNRSERVKEKWRNERVKEAWAPRDDHFPNKRLPVTRFPHPENASLLFHDYKLIPTNTMTFPNAPRPPIKNM